MVSAWYMDPSYAEKDQRKDHKYTPNREVTVDDLKKKTGVEYYYADVNDPSVLDKLRKDRGYSYEDVIDIGVDTSPDYDEKLKIFFKEHLHADEEIRYCVKGSGYFDVRDGNDKWIRIQITPGDLIILPAGIYHRFTLDTSDYIRAKRYFVGEPVWTPHNRPQEEHPARISYLKMLAGGLQQMQTTKG